MNYQEFLNNKQQNNECWGFKPIDIPDYLFDFQKHLVDWSLRKGRCAIFADCGLGKTPIQLVWADNIVKKTNKKILIITPLAVSFQTVREGEKFGIECKKSSDGKIIKHITVTNYERLHYFNPDDFIGVVCDESSAIKHFEGARQKIVTEFLRKIPYRLLCTATAAPNDFIELGTSSEALGQMGRMDMLETYFKNDENSLHPIWWGARWRFKGHSEEMFWRWVVSWARALRKPSDMDFDDNGFILPELITNEIISNASRPVKGFFVFPAETMDEQREERKFTIKERCEKVAELVSKKESSVIWCHLNGEGDYLEKIIKDAVQVKGGDSDEYKEETLKSFSEGKVKKLITKPRIGAFGMNWQHCSHMTFFPSHSFEQYYQGVRRCWRFGQKHSVTVDIVTTQGELGVLKNLQRKAIQADRMFSKLIQLMNNELKREKINEFTKNMEIPAWM